MRPARFSAALLGYSKGQIGLTRFFPREVGVQPGDSVQWTMTANNDAPHIITFLNGGAERDWSCRCRSRAARRCERGPSALRVDARRLAAGGPCAARLAGSASHELDDDRERDEEAQDAREVETLGQHVAQSLRRLQEQNPADSLPQTVGLVSIF
jgi:hypothetical protein